MEAVHRSVQEVFKLDNRHSYITGHFFFSCCNKNLSEKLAKCAHKYPHKNANLVLFLFPFFVNLHNFLSWISCAHNFHSNELFAIRVFLTFKLLISCWINYKKLVDWFFFLLTTPPTPSGEWKNSSSLTRGLFKFCQSMTEQRTMIKLSLIPFK